MSSEDLETLDPFGLLEDYVNFWDHWILNHPYIGSLNYDQTHEAFEFALSHLIYEKLKSFGWSCYMTPDVIPAILQTEPLYAQDSNQWRYEKNNKTLIVLMGDSFAKINDDRFRFDYAITDNVKLDRADQAFYLSPEMFGLFENVTKNSSESSTPPKIPSKIFNCFMSMASMTRQCWLYEFQRRNLLDKGHVSYLLSDLRFPVGERPRQDALNQFDKLLQTPINDVFESEHRVLRPKIPYKNFVCGLDDAILDSCISLITETACFGPDQIFVTEKTFRSLLSPRPFVIHWSDIQVGGIEYLRNLGFDVHDDLIDHSYDKEPHPVKRMQMILDQLENLDLSKFDRSLLEELQTRATNNLKIVQELRKKWPQKLRSLMQFIEKISQQI